MMKLTSEDTLHVASRIPRDVRKVLLSAPGKLFVAGGFVRAVVANEPPADVDILGSDTETMEAAAALLMKLRKDAREHVSKNARTILSPGRTPVQFITRWTYSDPNELIEAFDFTVCQAMVWPTSLTEWASLASDRFYVDLAARRLVYTSPERDEDAGGSLMRTIKYLKRGYTIQPPALASVVSRLLSGVRDSALSADEEGRTMIIAGLLREVDPSVSLDDVRGDAASTSDDGLAS